MTPRGIKIKSFNAADRVSTKQYTHFNPSQGEMHRLPHILFLWDQSTMYLAVRLWRSFIHSQSTPPGRRSCGSSSDCGCVPPTPAGPQPSCAAARKWGPGTGTSPESHPPYREASRPCGAGPSLPGSSTRWLRCRDLQSTGRKRGAGGKTHSAVIAFPT